MHVLLTLLARLPVLLLHRFVDLVRKALVLLALNFESASKRRRLGDMVAATSTTPLASVFDDFYWVIDLKQVLFELTRAGNLVSCLLRL